MKPTLLCILIILNCFGVCAQVLIPNASPKASISQKIGLTQLEIIYSRPSVKGRSVFGEMVPYDEVWRTGANECTQLKFDTDLALNGHYIPAGVYCLFTIPKPNLWTIIFNKEADQWGAFRYNQAMDALRFDVTPQELGEAVESFEISLQTLIDSTAQLIMAWDRTAVQFEVKSNLDSMISIQIEKMLATPSIHSWDYYNAAQYYFKTKQQKDQALIWMGKAIELEPFFWWPYEYALMLQDVGKNKAAKAALEYSLELSKAQNDTTFIKNQLEPLFEELR